MAIGGFAVERGPVVDGDESINSKITASVVITCIVAASSGLIFGYDIGISGGVTTMVPFLHKFFPSVERNAAKATTNIYCMYDSQVLTAFTSSLYLAGLLSSLLASRVTAVLGRKATMILGGCTFLAGATINAAAANVAMLILGRILLGFGVGFTNQAAPVYLSEVAPPKWRGAFNIGFQFFLGIGVVVANCINYATAKHTWGWRLSLGLAALPAAIMTTGALLISDSPNSLVERGKLDQARVSLLKARGSAADIDAELSALVKASEAAKATTNEPFVTILERRYRPYLVMAVAIPFFQQISGIGVIAFYAPVLFQSVGFGSDSALIAAIILGVVNLGSIAVSAGVVDRFGRRALFLEGGAQMFICQVAVACVLVATVGSDSAHMSEGNAVLVLIFICFYCAGFGWSWGPLCFLVTSEIFPLKIRPMGQSISVGVNFATTFVLSQTFLTTLCHFRYGIFLFYAGFVVVMTAFVLFLLPETKGVPLDSMHAVWERHWFWGRFVRTT